MPTKLQRAGLLLFQFGWVGAISGDDYNRLMQATGSVNRPVGSCVEDDDCDEGNFCGIDETCHSYNCENFYTFSNVTSGGDISGAPLTCLGYTTGEPDFLHAVSWGCRPNFPGIEIASGQGVSQKFNRRCSANPIIFDGSATFTCYDLRPDTNFDFFLQQASSLFIASCEAEDYDLPGYIYPIASRTIFGNEFSRKDKNTYDPPQRTFNMTRAGNVLYYILETENSAPTPAPEFERRSTSATCMTTVSVPILILALFSSWILYVL